MLNDEIRDEHGDRIKSFLPGQPGDPGVTASDNRLFLNAVLWIARTGSPWRALPSSFGPWNSVWRRFDSRKNREQTREVDWHIGKQRNLVERFINRIKRYRRVATRYDKKAGNFLAFVHVASIMILPR